MSETIHAKPLEPAAFAPFGDVLAADGASFPINEGRCDRFNDLSRPDVAGPDAQTIISVFRSRPAEPPYAVALMERHPLGSQVFSPMQSDPFLVVVAADVDGVPGAPVAFLTRPGQGVNLRRNVWHAPLMPLGQEGDFLVVDRGGAPAPNLEEHRYAAPFFVDLPSAG